MTNQEIAKIFYEIALYLEMQDVAFKPPARGRGSPKIDTTRFRRQAYEKAAANLETLSEDVEDIYKRGGIKSLQKISGIGKNMAEKIVEYLKTGKIREHEAFKKKIPVNIGELTAVEGIGPKTVKTLYKELKIKNLNDLEKAAKAHKIAPLFGFGEKTEQNILQSIAFLKRSGGRFLLGEILPHVYKIINKLKNLKEVKKISEAGSVRRRKETVGDVDILVALKSQTNADSPPQIFGENLEGQARNDAEKVINFFVKLPGVVKIWGQGPTKASIRLKQGFDVDLRVLPEKQFGSALQYFTGSKEHNIVLRKIALDKGLKLSEYGLFRGSKLIAGKTEKEIYEKLGMDYIEPEMRENIGEIEAAINHQLPRLINYKDIKGDLHCHSHWGQDADEHEFTTSNFQRNFGRASADSRRKERIDKYIQIALEMGYEYIGIADHTKFLAIEHGLNEKQLLEQRKYIDKINLKLRDYTTKPLKVLQGCEANILADGSIDISDEVLAKLDFVIAGVHSQFKMTKDQMTERIIKAMRNPNVDIISHPTGRIIQHRDEYEIDFDKILKVAKETNTILEINAYPVRLDLNDRNIRKAKEAGVKMIINTDSHQPEQMRFMEYGVYQARRGWAEKKDIINCWPVEKLLKMLK